jgi:hypothetical protein
VIDATILIPTYDRPTQLRRAVESALEQSLGSHEIVVVDDGSPRPPRLPHHPRLQVIELGANRGHSAARNVGLERARGRWITSLDDDDELLAHHLEVALDALADTDLPGPVASLSGLDVVDVEGRVVETRLPPTLPRGSLYSLEEPPPGTSFGVRNTLVAEREVLRALGGWDETFASRVLTELFLRLNPVCSLLGIPTVTYHRYQHPGPQVTDDPVRRLQSQRQLEYKHAALFAARPERTAEMVFRQAFKLSQARRPAAALATWARAVRLHPRRAGGSTAAAVRDRWRYARRPRGRDGGAGP